MKLTRDKIRAQRRAALDTAKKIRLEPKLAADMRRMFKSIVKDFKNSYPENQETITPYHYLSDATAILRTHYRKVTKAFKSSLRDEIHAKPSNDTKAKKVDPIDKKLEAKLSGYIIEHSDKQAKIIIKTTHDQLEREVQKAVSAAAQTGNPIDSTAIAKYVADKYLNQINGRSTTIAMTETQSMAEKTKDMEMEEVNDDDTPEDEGGYAGRNFSRMWVAILDERTRDWHAEADGQEVGVNEPFIVNGEELDYPGDPNGSDDNIINCRCASIPVED